MAAGAQTNFLKTGFYLKSMNSFPSFSYNSWFLLPFQKSIAWINESTIGKIWEGYTFLKIASARLTYYLEKHSLMFVTSLLLKVQFINMLNPKIHAVS